jgi:hypothetical protein
VREGGEAEEADEEDGGAEGGAVKVIGIGIGDRVALEARHLEGQEVEMRGERLPTYRRDEDSRQRRGEKKWDWLWVCWI